MPKIKIVCDRCGSEDVRRDACASWNTDTQDWELASTYDSFSCDDCDDECGVEEIEIPDDDPDGEDTHHAAPCQSAPPAVPKGWKLVPEKPTDAMMHAAAAAHYGKRAAAQIGIHGIDVTANDINYTFARAFRRFWKGALAAVPA